MAAVSEVGRVRMSADLLKAPRGSLAQANPGKICSSNRPLRAWEVDPREACRSEDKARVIGGHYRQLHNIFKRMYLEPISELYLFRPPDHIPAEDFLAMAR